MEGTAVLFLKQIIQCKYLFHKSSSLIKKNKKNFKVGEEHNNKTGRLQSFPPDMRNNKVHVGVKRSSDGFSHQVKEVIQIVLKKLLPVIPKGKKLVNCRLVKPDLTHLIFFPT